MWACGVLLFHYGVGKGEIGEPWVEPSGAASVAGFALLLLGTILYAQVRLHLAARHESVS